jgi:hypothetical protein
MKQSFQALSPESKSWLVSALDPYHDFQLDLEGLPDERCAPSVVQIHNQSLTLTVPATAAPAGNWDASVLYTGVNTSTDSAFDSIGGMVTEPNSMFHSYNSGGLVQGTAFGSLNIWAGASGTSMSTGSPAGVPDTYRRLGSVLGTDRCRVIGVAFEIHNTTAEVYKQGSLTVAMLPDSADDNALTVYQDSVQGGAINKEFQADRCCIQACTLPPLMAVPGSQTWPAKLGVYAVPRMVEVPRRLNLYNPGSVVGQIGNNTRGPVLYGTDGKVATLEPSGNALWAGGQLPILQPTGPSGFSPMQVFITGLSPQSTLTVTFRTIVEYFPSLGSVLLPNATPSPSFDPKALALYGAIIKQAPYAVPVNQNSAGDYFRKVMMVAAAAAKLLSPLAGDYAPLVYQAGNAVQTYLGKQRRKVSRDEAGSRAMVVRKK